MTWDLSSAGRASALQAEGHRFEPCRPHPLTKYGEIAQLARAHGSYPWCRGFESPSRYLTEKSVTNKYGILAQLGEHLPYKQRVIGSSPIGPIYTSIYGGIAQLARARGSYPRCRWFKSSSRYFLLQFFVCNGRQTQTRKGYYVKMLRITALKLLDRNLSLI